MRFRKITALFIATTMAFSLCGCGVNIKTPEIPPHLYTTENPRSPAIDGFDQFVMPEIDDTLTNEQYRDRVELLYNTVVYDGKRPVFAHDDPVERIYTAAHKILSDYVHDEWQGEEFEVNVVHTVHDWLITNCKYDFALYKAYTEGNTDFASDPAFSIDGVLLNGRAVCDGLARTFNFLCAMEGIQSVRVTGSFASATHAWNKVRIADEWYNVDITADAVYYSVGDKNYKQIAHGYMLVSDDAISRFAPGGHVFNDTPFVASSDYDYCIHDPIKIGNTSYSRVVKTPSQLNNIFYALSEQRLKKGKIGKIELRLDFDGKTQVNEADMYSAEIRAAYKKVDDVGFDINGRALPYFRFPNGVYLFLIYK